MKNFILGLAVLSSVVMNAQTQIIAHRGFWQTQPTTTENSLKSLENAQKLKLYGSEFDVRMTKDGVLVINHDEHHGKMEISETDFKELETLKLSNGENFPTLKEYLKQGKKDKSVKLIVEIKPDKTKEKEDELTTKTIKMIKEMGHKIFLDLKLHDIPNTVKSAMRQLAKLDVDMVNVHASGGIEMMKAAIEGLEEGKTSGKRPLCIAVTCLTSLDQDVLDNQLLIHEPLENVVLKWAENAKAAGLDGVVCSPLESKIIHDHLGKEFLTVTPGIRLASDNVNDQKRVTTPAMAKELTSSYIVVGRTITGSQDPLATYKKVYQDFQGE